MATYTTHHHDAAHVAHDEHAAPRQRTSPVLVAALGVALVALGAWWYTQRDNRAADAPAPAATTLPSEPVAPPSTVATRDARPATDAPGRRAPVVADRPARPLAGNPMPEYPRAALRSGEEGSVLLSIALDARGVPTDVNVIQRNGTRDRSFDRAAIQAARQWRFEPAIRDGKAVPATVQLPVDFRQG
ncbi:energy transducer TonB [Pseudoxanthomonas sp. 10H]|uniref:energy transducer TonB n=1 Tax=Pseudoxanthomonas sp. 10H TaxID=3242729 RepID=UPI0035583F8E